MLALAWVWLTGTACAPTSLSPSLIRMTPPDPTRTATAVGGLRTGPRFSTALTPTSSLPGGTFVGDGNSFAFPQWSVAYDLGLTTPVSERTALHFGAQGEFYYPVPLPAYGAYIGVSHYVPVGPFSIAPALCVRGASDLGLPSLGGTGTNAGAEFSTTLALRAEDSIRLGLVPFVGYHQVWAATESTALFTGGVLALKFEKIELTAGFGRVFLGSGQSWNVPLIGVRGGD